MYLLKKYFTLTVGLVSLFIINMWLSIRNARIKDRMESSIDAASKFEKAVEEVDQMDDNDLVSILSSVHSQSPKMHNSNKSSSDK